MHTSTLHNENAPDPEITTSDRADRQDVPDVRNRFSAPSACVLLRSHLDTFLLFIYQRPAKTRSHRAIPYALPFLGFLRARCYCIVSSSAISEGMSPRHDAERDARHQLI
ncbi:hypothetical protein Trydic_g10918 [Trypoxylus dichotomus]